MQKFMKIITLLRAMFLRRWLAPTVNTSMAISRAKNIYHNKSFSLASIVVSILLPLTVASAHAQNLRVMPMGDSITSGFRSSNNNGYRGPLYDQLVGQVKTLDFVGSIRDGVMSDPEHEGHSGWRIDQIASIATGAITQYRPNIVLLHIGSNDLNGNFQVDTAPNRLAALIDQIFSAAPDATVLVAAIIRSSNDTTESRIINYNNQTRFTVESRANQGKHIALVSMDSVSNADLSDGLHPNDTGYKKMADAWNAGVKLVIAKGWVGDSTPIGPSNGAHFLHPAHAQAMALDDYAADLRYDNPIILWQSQNSANQSWVFSDLNVTPAGYYNIATSLGAFCLSASGTIKGSPVTLRPCDGSLAQAWRATPQTGGYTLNPASNTGLCLDAAGWGNTNNTPVNVWTCNGGDNQKWRP